jgi:hypothetical protein
VQHAVATPSDVPTLNVLACAAASTSDELEEPLNTEPVSGIRELIDWLTSLKPPFAFLLALPFLVGLAGLVSEYLRGRRARTQGRTEHLK